MNIIGILCITLAINSWGKAMFDLDTFPTWANVTGVWAWFCRKRGPTHLSSLSTGARQKPLVRVLSHRTTCLTAWVWLLLEYKCPKAMFWKTPESCLRKKVVINMIGKGWRVVEIRCSIIIIIIIITYYHEVESQIISWSWISNDIYCQKT